MIVHIGVFVFHVCLCEAITYNDSSVAIASLNDCILAISKKDHRECVSNCY